MALQAHAIAKWKGDQLLGSIVLPASYVQVGEGVWGYQQTMLAIAITAAHGIVTAAEALFIPFTHWLLLAQALPLDGEVRDDSLSLTLGKAACGSIYVRLSRATKPLELPNETYTPAAAGGGCLRGCLSCCSCCDEPGNDYLNYATSSCMAFCLGACCMASS